MQKVKVTVNFKVPSWDFCNDDRLDGGELTKSKCRFCDAERGHYSCRLYGEALWANDGLIQKTHQCKLASIGIATEVEEPAPGPTISPKELMKHTIELYSKTVKDLQSQGYPTPLAEKVAKQHILK